MTAAGHPVHTRLGRYELVRVLGRGAMGVVYEARDPRLDRPVAVKTIVKGHLLDDTVAADYSARFVREAQAVARLAHPHIVTVFDFGEDDDAAAYIVMEFIRGRELAAHFEAGEFFDLPAAVRILCELLDALGYAHEHGIVHHDVKPANVMLDTDGRVKLTDFGVARMTDAGADRTLPGTMVGTPSYMSPEQIQGLAVGSRTDLFAVGVILYQFLTHRKPFAGAGHWTVQKMIVGEDPPPPSLARHGVPAAFDPVVRRALAKDPEQRYATAAAFAADLRSALAAVPRDDDDGEATRVVVPARSKENAAQALPGAAAASPPVPAAPAPARSGIGVWSVGVGLSGVAVLVAGVMVVRSGNRNALAPTLPAPADTSASTPVGRPASAASPALLPASAAVPAPAPTLAPVPVAVPASASSVPTHGPEPVAVRPPSAALSPPGRGASKATRSPTAAAGLPARAEPHATSRPAPAGRQRQARCGDLLQRLQLGETLSPGEAESLRKECAP